MIDASTRLRRAIINNDLLLCVQCIPVKRILKNSPSTLSTPTPPTLTLHPTATPTPTSLTTLPTTGFTPLHLATSTPNSLPIVTYLIDVHAHESSCISRDNNGNTPLMIACQHNNIPVVALLAERFPKCLDWKNKQGLTALMIAAKMGFEGCVKALLEAGGAGGGRRGEKRRELAGEHEDEEGGEEEEEENRSDYEEEYFSEVDVDAVDGAGNTALHHASAYGHLKTIRTLIEYNASPHIQNRQKYTPQEFSFTSQAETYFTQLVAEKEARDVAHARNTRAATPVPGRNEKTMTTPARQRASSGS